MAVEKPREIIKPKPREEINAERLARRQREAKERNNRPKNIILLEKARRGLEYQKKQITIEYSRLTPQTRTKLFKDLSIEAEKIIENKRKGKTGFFGDKEPVMRKRIQEISFRKRILEELIRADKLIAQKKGTNANSRVRPNSEMIEGLDNASAVQVNSRGTKASATIPASESSSKGPIRVVDKNGNAILTSKSIREPKPKEVSKIIDPKTGLPVGAKRNVKLVKPEPTGKGSVVVKGASFAISEPQERSLVKYIRGELERLRFDSKAIESIVEGALVEANNLNPRDRRRLFELLNDYPRLNPGQRQTARREILQLLQIKIELNKRLSVGKEQKLLTEGEKEPFELDGRGPEKKNPKQLEMDFGPIKEKKTPEQERAETIFITFIRENPSFRARFTEFNQFFEWVKTTFNFTDARQVHQTIINLSNNPASVSSIKVLIETQQTVINILKGVKGSKLSEEDLKKINELILRAETNIVGKLKITRDDLIRAIEAEAEKARLRDFGLKTKLAELERKVDKISEDLKTILEEVRKDRKLSAEDKKFIESEFLRLSEALRDMETRSGLQANRIEETLRLATESLAKIENALKSQPQIFEKILKTVLAESLAKNNDVLIGRIEKKWKGRYKQILQRFAEVRNLMRDGFKLTQDHIFELGENLIALHQFSSTRFGDLEKIMSEIKDLVGETNLKKIVKEAITESDIPQGVLDKMKEYFKGTEYADVIRDALKERFDNLESRMDAIRDELKTAIEGIEGFTKAEKEALMDNIIHIISEIGETKTLSKESLEILKELKEKVLTKDNIKEILDPILETALEANNTKIIEQINGLGLLSASEFKSTIEELLTKIDERFTELEEKIDGKDKEPEPKEPDKEPEPKEPEEPEKPKEPKKPEPWYKRVWGGMGGFSGLAIIALLALILWTISRSKDAATSRISQAYNITPVFGETLKTATQSSSSILGSLGGINPLIIIGIIAVLFLLFPKK